MPQLGTPEIIIIAVVVVLLFGSKKLPDAARSIGKSLRIFKTEMKDLHGDDDERRAEVSRPRELPATPPPAPPAAAEPPVAGSTADPAGTSESR